MSNEIFAASQQWVGFWKKAAEDHMARMQALSEEWSKMEGKGFEQATTAVDEMSKLTKETLAYTGQLATEWRKLYLEMVKKGAATAKGA